jgi:tetratricopeptide (TPR) repeat protein
MKPAVNNFAPDQDAARCFQAGLKLLKREDTREAILALEQAHRAVPGNPLYMSYLGLALILARSRTKEAIRLCEKAAVESQFYPEVYHNLGNVYLMRGQKGKARQAFLIGLKIDRGHAGLLEAMEELGVRRSPPVPFLCRDHVINKYLGKVLRRLKLR